MSERILVALYSAAVAPLGLGPGSSGGCAVSPRRTLNISRIPSDRAKLCVLVSHPILDVRRRLHRGCEHTPYMYLPFHSAVLDGSQSSYTCSIGTPQTPPKQPPVQPRVSGGGGDIDFPTAPIYACFQLPKTTRPSCRQPLSFDFPAVSGAGVYSLLVPLLGAQTPAATHL